MNTPSVKKGTHYVATKDFSFVFNNTLLHFKAGEIITSEAQVQRMLTTQSPIKELDEAGTLAACPHCGHKFFV